MVQRGTSSPLVGVGVLTLFAALCSPGCVVTSSSSHKSSDNGDPPASSGTHTPVQACLDMADAVGKAAERCNLGTYQENRDGFISTAALGNCNNIIGMRDEASLYATCLPSFPKMSCPDLQAGTLDPSCSRQLLRQ